MWFAFNGPCATFCHILVYILFWNLVLNPSIPILENIYEHLITCCQAMSIYWYDEYILNIA